MNENLKSEIVPKVYPCVLFDNEQKQAAEFYLKTFSNGKQIIDFPYAELFQVEGLQFFAINGGPTFKTNPTFSFMVFFKDTEELESIWKKLVNKGIVLMPLGEYDWSKKYGWVQDRFGVSWQLLLSEQTLTQQRIAPVIMFSQEFHGNTEPALNFYRELFKNFNLERFEKYDSGPYKGKVKYAQLTLEGTRLAFMDSGIEQPFTFPNANSIVIECDSQQEIDYFWNAIKKGGKELQSGWIQDQFGVRWQIVPSDFKEWMKREDWPNIMVEILRMTKIDWNYLQKFIHKN